MNTSIGILGGGQLGRMLNESLTPWAVDISYLDKDKSFPVGKISPNLHLGDFNNYEDVVNFGKDKDVISIEIENVNTQALHQLESMGVKCYPQAHIIEIIKDKGTQKQYYAQNGFPSADFQLLNTKEEITNAIQQGKINLPFIQKARTAGYDGRGVQLIKKETIGNIWDIPSVIENLVDIDKEISIIVARGADGQTESFPPVEMVVNPETNQLDHQICPAMINKAIANNMTSIAHSLINKWEMIGLLAIEFFLDKDQNIYINEVAPRPHNSGHHSIEGCTVSQFEQLGRVLLGLELIEPDYTLPSIMLNIVGAKGHIGPAIYQGLEKCLNTPDVYVHIYGKEVTKPNRKMGHITILNTDIIEASRIANIIRENLKVVSEEQAIE